MITKAEAKAIAKSKGLIFKDARRYGIEVSRAGDTEIHCFPRKWLERRNKEDFTAACDEMVA